MNAVLTRICVGLILLSTSAQGISQNGEEAQKKLVAHLQKTQEYLSEKRPDLAIPELQAVAAMDPKNVEVQGNLGVLLYFQGKTAEAIPHLRAAIESQPSLIKLQGVLGIAELRTQDFAGARKDLEASFPQIPDRKFKSEVGLELVGLYTQSGSLDEAAGIIAQLRKVDPDNPEVLYAAYRTYSDLSGESMLALSITAPDSAQMHQLIAHEETRQGNTNGAIAHYRKAIELNPHLPGVHFELAELLRTSVDVNIKRETEQQYRAALAENPVDERTICRIGEIEAGKGNTQQAFEAFSRAVQLQHADSDAKLDLAKTLIEMNQEDKALTLLKEMVQLEPTDAIAHYRLATLYRKNGRMEDAKREVDLYKKYKAMKEKLRAMYKELQIQPAEIQADE